MGTGGAESMSNCDDPATRQCSPGETEDGRCGFCGSRSRDCTDDCRWGDWADCGEEGECRAGALESESCGGACGERARTCTAECTWNEWSECGGGGAQVCSAGQVETEACGACGERARACGDECTWGDWGECQAGGTCVPGTVEAEACGNCAARERNCNAQCEWEDFGECVGGGQCNPGESEDQACGNCGTYSRDCTDECIWGAFGACDGEGTCAAGEEEQSVCGNDEGACAPGVQTRTCSAQCEWEDFGMCDGETGPAEEICGNGIDEDCDGEDLVVLDMYDAASPNDTCGTCTMLNNGDPDPEDLSIMATIHSAGDQDFYCFVVEDETVSVRWERIIAGLSGIGAERDYDLFLYRNQEECQANNPLVAGIAGAGEDEALDWSEERCFRGCDDSGTYIIEVRPVGANSYSCEAPYTMTLSGLRVP